MTELRGALRVVDGRAPPLAAVAVGWFFALGATAGVRGGGFGVLRTVFLLGAIGPVVVGTLFDAGRADAGLLLAAVTSAAVVPVCAGLPTLGRAQ